MATQIRLAPAIWRVFSHVQDLLNIARTTLSSKLLTQHKDYFARLAVDAILRLKSSGNLEAIQLIKKLGSNLSDSYLEEGWYGGGGEGRGEGRGTLLCLRVILERKTHGGCSYCIVDPYLRGSWRVYVCGGLCPILMPLRIKTGSHVHHLTSSPPHTQGFLLEKKVGVNQPKRLEDARILIANTSMDTDKIKVYTCQLCCIFCTLLTSSQSYSGVHIGGGISPPPPRIFTTKFQHSHSSN